MSKLTVTQRRALEIALADSCNTVRPGHNAGQGTHRVNISTLKSLSRLGLVTLCNGPTGRFAVITVAGAEAVRS